MMGHDSRPVEFVWSDLRPGTLLFFRDSIDYGTPGIRVFLGLDKLGRAIGYFSHSAFEGPGVQSLAQNTRMYDVIWRAP